MYSIASAEVMQICMMFSVALRFWWATMAVSWMTKECLVYNLVITYCRLWTTSFVFGFNSHECT